MKLLDEILGLFWNFFFFIADMLRTFIFAILNFAFKTFISAKKRKQLEKLFESFIQPLLNPLLIILQKLKNLREMFNYIV